MLIVNKPRLLKLGGYASYFLSALFAVASLLMVFASMSLEITSHEDFLDADKILPIVNETPAFVYSFLLGILFSVSLFFLAIACGELLRDVAPLAAVASILLITVQITLTLAADISRVVAFPVMAKMYLENPDSTGSAYLAASSILGGLNVAALMVFGVWLIVVCGAGIQTCLLPRLLCQTGIVLGIIHLLCLVLAIPHVADILWFPFLGLALHRKSTHLNE